MLNPKNKDCRHNSYDPQFPAGGTYGKQKRGTEGIGEMVVVARLTRSAIGWTIALAFLLNVGPNFNNALGQEIPPVQLDMPILPDATVHGGTVPGLPAPDQTVAYPGPASPEGAVVGSAVGNVASPQIIPTNFTGCMSCGSIGCSGCNQYSGPGFACPPTSVGFWIRSDYLIWYEKDANTIPLVTTSNGIPADQGQLLTLDAAETRVLFAGEVGDNPIDGWRLEAGIWLDASQTRGIMGRYFKVGNRHSSFSAGPTDFNFLGIPFFNTDINAAQGVPLGPGEDAVNLSIPNERNGEVRASITGDVESWEVLGRVLSETGCNYRRDWLFGYRNFTFGESLSLVANTITLEAPVNGVVPDGTLTSLSDQFDVENRFHGLDLGMTGSYHQGKWSMDYLAKMALGIMTADVDVSGTTLNTIPGATPFRLEGGVFSQESNIGSHEDSTFAVIPEFDLNIGYGITPNMDITVGYTFIWVSSLTRAGDVDRTIDEGLLLDLDPINSNRPQPDFDTDTYFIHGFNFGVTGRF